MPARVPRSCAACELHANVLTNHRAAQTPVTTSATITASDVGKSGAGFGVYNPPPTFEPPPDAATNAADTADEPATAPERVPRPQREQHARLPLS